MNDTQEKSQHYYSISQISQWKLDDIAPKIIELWKNGQNATPDNVESKEWMSEERRAILDSLVMLERRQGGEIMIGIPDRGEDWI